MKGFGWKKGALILTSLLLLLVGCSQESAKPAESTTPAAGSTAGKPEAGKKPRVAFVYIGVPGDGGWTFQHDEGRKAMEKELGIKADVVENVPEGADSERVFEQLAQDHDIIFGTSFGYMDYMYKVAQKHPNVVFMHCSGYKLLPNMSTYLGREYESMYLAGMAAGKMTKNNLIGYVAAFPIPEVIYSINAYVLGAQSVNPAAKVKVVWSNTWFDPATEKQAAISLLDQGADVLAAYQDSPATLQAAQERGKFAGGNDSDMNRYAPENYITNNVWNWGPYYTKVVKDVMEGKWKSESYWGSMKEGIFDLAPFGKNVPADVKALVEAKKKEILDGKFQVYKGPIYDQAGQLKVAEGKVLEDKDILEMNWLVKGVEATLPK